MTAPLRCHWCSNPDETIVVGWLVELRSGGTTWEIPVCDVHARTRQSPSYAGDRVVFRPLDGKPVAHGEPCGAYAVVEYDHGSASKLRWCERTAGPCPFPGADVSTSAAARPCAVDLVAQYDALALDRRRVTVESST